MTTAGGYAPINDLVANTLINGLTFDAGAGASYTLSGNAIDYTGDLNNISNFGQNITLDMRLRANVNVFTGNQTLVLNNSLSSVGNVGLIKNDTGTLVLGGTVGYTGNTVLNNGTILVTGVVAQGAANAAGLNVGATAGNSALILNNNASWIRGNNLAEVGSAANANGAIVVNQGAIFTTGQDIWLGSSATGSGSLLINGGTVTMTNGWLALGRARSAGDGAGTGVVTVNSGLLSTSGQPITIGSFNNGAALVNTLRGVVTVNSAGTLLVNNNIRVSETYDGNLNINGGILNMTGNIDVVNGGNATSGIFTLSGGTVTATDFRSSGGNAGKSATLNFNGGIVRARNNTGAFIAGSLSNVYLWNGGLNLDDQGFNLTIVKPLLAPTGNGIKAAGLSASGFGYVGEPEVLITGGGGTGASAVALMDANGNVTGINLLSPGTGYTSEPTMQLVGGGGSGGVSGIALQANASTGGLTKIGSGTVTLQGLNTYTGPTVVSGTLNVAAGNNITNAINPASALTLNGGNFQFSGTAGSTNSQTFASTMAGKGPDAITIVPNGGSNTINLALGALSRSGAGAILNINSTSGSTTITTTSANAGPSGTILGGWATFNRGTWASSAGTGSVAGALTGLTTYNAGFAPNTDVDVQAGTSTPGAMSVDSIRFNAAGVADVNTTGNLTVSSGGILVTANVGANNVSLNNNALTSGNGADLIVHQYNTAGTFTIGSQITGNIGLVKVGGGKLSLTNPNNTFTGKVYVYGGTGVDATSTLTIAADGSLGALPGSPVADAITLSNNATLQLGGSFSVNSNRGIFLDGFGGGIDTNGNNATYAGVMSGTGAFKKAGAGLLTVTGINTYTGATTVAGGTLSVTGVITSAPILATPSTVGTIGGVPATLVIDGGTMTAAKNSAPSLIIGGAANNSGFLTINSGVLTTGSEVLVGNDAGTGNFGAVAINGGTTNVGSWLSMGRGNSAGLWTQTGGTVNILTNAFTIANINGLSVGTANFSGGTFNSNITNGGLFVGEFGAGQLNVTGTALLNLDNNGLRAGVTTNATLNGVQGIINLAGGTVTTNRVQLSGNTNNTAGTTVALLNFHNGTLKSTAAPNGSFISQGVATAGSTVLASTYIYEGGTIDNAGVSVTVSTPFFSPTGNGLTTVPLTGGGSGYLSAPVVQITGGGGVGASAIANVAGGVVTSITVTNPGTGYTGAPTINLLGGSPTAAAAINAPSIAIGANVASGALNLTGVGTLTLSASNHTFTGPTIVAQGTLRGSGSGNPSLIYVSPVTVNSGANLAGSGTLTAGVTVLGGGSVNLINNSAATLTVGTGMTVGSGGVPSTLKFDFAGSSNSAVGNDLVNLGANTLTVNGTTGALVSLNNLGFMATGSSYTLMTYGANTNIAGVVLDPASKKIGFDNATLTVDANTVYVTIAGAAIPANAWWTGQYGGLWSAIGGVSLDQSNFNTTQTGGVNTQKYPTLPTAVFFSTTGPVAQNFNTTLGANFGIKSLTIKAGTGSAAVSIAGNNVLTIDGGPSGGITVENGTSLNISANVGLNASQTWTNQSATPLVVSGVISGAASASTLTTVGLVTLSGANTFAGGVQIGNSTLVLGNVTATGNGPVGFVAGQAGRLQVNGLTATATGLNGGADAFVENGGNNNGGLLVNTTTGTNTFLGTIQNGGAGNMDLILAGGGSLTLGSSSVTAQINTTGIVTVRQGTEFLTNANINLTGGNPFRIGDTSGLRAKVVMDNGTQITTPGIRPGFQVGQAAGAIADLRLNNGTITVPGNEFWIAGAGSTTNPAYGAITMSGGAINSGTWFVVGFNGDRAILNMTGGQITVSSFNMTIAAGQATTASAQSYGIVNLMGGQINLNPANNTGVYVGEGGEAHLEISGTGVMSMGGTGTVRVSQTANSTGIVNLRGGTLATSNITGTGNGIINFNGGTLLATNPGATWVSPITKTTVWAGGAILDDGGNTTTINAPLTAPTGNGVSSTTLAVTGYTNAIDTPLVRFSNSPTNIPATGLANIDANGNVTSITVTSPGQGYTSAPTVTLIGAGFTQASGTNSSIAAPVIAANVGGGVTKNGSGTLTLNNALNSWTGPTVVTAGTLAFSANATLPGTVTVNNNATLALRANAQLIGPSAVAVSGKLAMAPGSVITNGPVTLTNGVIGMDDSVIGTMTLGSTTTINGGTLTFDVAPLSSDLLTTTQLTANSGVVSIHNLGLQPGQTYTLATFPSSTYGSFVLDPNSTSSGLNTLTLLKNGTSLQLQVVGPAVPAAAFWTGAQGSNWDALSGNNTNFNTDATNGVNTHQLPGLTTDVVFATTTPTPQNLSTNLNSTIAVKSLTIQSGNNVTVTGSPTAFLDVDGAGGITIQSGATLALNTDLVLGSVQTWNNQTGAPMVVNGNISGPGGITLSGDLTLNSSANTYTGGTTIGAGNVITLNGAGGGLGFGPTNFGANSRIDINGVSVGIGAPTSDGTAVIQNISANNATVTINSTSNTTWNGQIKDGTGGGIMNMSLSAPTADGFGTLTLANTQSYTGSTQVRRGMLIVPSGVNITGTTLQIGNLAGKAVMTVGSGSTITGGTGQNSIQIGNAANGNGLLINNGAVITNPLETWIGMADTGWGKYEQNSGTLTSGSWLAVSRGGGQGIMTINGGLVTCLTNNITIGSFIGASVDQMRAVATVNGGTLNAVNQIYVGEFNTTIGRAVLNITGSGQVVAGAGTTINVNPGTAATPSGGILNLAGGTLTTTHVNSNGADGSTRRSMLNFNGGVLAAAATADATFITGLSRTNSTFSGAFILAGGANIDVGSQTLTMTDPLMAPSGNGVSVAGATFSNNGGYIGEPVVDITGGGGYGATASAVVNPATGLITAINLTSPGVGYTSMPTITLLGGGGSATLSGATMASNASIVGGLTKLGTGTLILTGVGSTYRGATVIPAGAIRWNATGAAAGPITGAGAALVTAGSTLTSDGVTAGTWQIDGTHTIRANNGTAAGQAAGASKVGTLAIAGATGAWTGKLDLTNNALIVPATNSATQAGMVTQIQDQVASGRTLTGTWTGTGITASTIPGLNTNASANAYTLAIGDAGDLGISTYRGQTVDANSTIVVQTFFGDANLDGKVDAFDLNILASHWQQPSGALFSAGDFTGDGIVNAFDLNALAANWQRGVGGALVGNLADFPGLTGAISAVPEPASLAVLALGGAALLGRRRRKI